MKKRRLSILLSIVMLFSLLPTTALAAGNYPDHVRVFNANGDTTSLSDKQYLVANSDTAVQDGYNGTQTYVARYDKSSGTLYLRDYHGVAADNKIFADGDLNIKVESDSSFTTSTTATNPLYGIRADSGKLNISGSGKLTVTAKGSGNVYGISAKEGVTISAPLAVTVEKNSVEENGPVYGIYAQSGAISLSGNDMTVTATGGTENAYGVYNEAQTSSSAAGNGNIDISGKLTVNLSNGSYNRGISSQGGDITLNGATVKILGSYRYGIFNVNGNVVIKNSPDVELTSTTPSGEGICTYDGGALTIENSTVKVSANALAANLKGNVSIKDSKIELTSTYNHNEVISTGNSSLENTIDLSGSGSVTLTASGNQEYAMITGKVTLGANTKCEKGKIDNDSYDGEYDTASNKTVLKFVHESTAPTATVANVSIVGVKGSPITSQPVNITLMNDKFKAIAKDENVKDWFTNRPAGLEAKISMAVNENDTTATIEISGTPSETSSAPLIIKIPAANLASNADLTVTSNENAVFAITTPITEALVPVSGLTGKTYNESAQQPTFGGSLTPGTDYTVSYAPQSGSTGTLNSDNKPVGAGTYLVTVTGKGSYTGSFTEVFKIDKADPTYTPPTAQTGLTYTGSALLLIDFGSVTKGGEMQYKLDGGSYSRTIPTAINAGNYTVYYQITETDNYKAVSNTQVGSSAINIAQVEWGTPTEALVSVNPTTVGGSEGKITGTTSAMQYKKSTDSSWADCTGEVTGLTAGTYYVRYKADSNHTASDINYKTVTLTDPGTTLYGVTVTDGTADPTGNQAAGTEVTITANTKTGFTFKQWTGLDDTVYKVGSTKTSNPATFTMPAFAVNVTATYEAAALTGTASITGTEKFGQTLTADTTGITNNTGTLIYKWYRGSDEIIGATGSTYTLTADDIGKTITVEITSSIQTGKINGSTTGTIEKADGPAAPAAFRLNFTLNSDGKTFTATIPTVAGGEYSFDGANYSAANTKKDCVANTSYTGYARVKETATHKASTATNSTQTSPKLTVATPTFTPNGVSSFSGTQSVTITCDTVDAKIYYTTNGTDPTTASGIEYKNALTLTSTTTLKAIAVKADMNDSAIATATFTKASGGGGGSSGGSYVPKTQKPEIKAAAGGKTVLSKDGTTLTITADAGKVIDKVLLNGKDMGAVSELKGLKTGDKVEVIFKDQVTEPTKEELDKAAKEAAGELVLAARSAKLKNGSVKIMLKDDLKAITDAGYTVKYKFYRSTKKSAGYKAVLTKKAPTYFNTYGKKGTMYYYKARVMIYDKDGNFVAQTALKQCKYANRLWTK